MIVKLWYDEYQNWYDLIYNSTCQDCLATNDIYAKIVFLYRENTKVQKGEKDVNGKVSS